jgi:hypothetical protein
MYSLSSLSRSLAQHYHGEHNVVLTLENGVQVQGLGDSNSEEGWAISDHSNTELQRNV